MIGRFMRAMFLVLIVSLVLLMVAGILVDDIKNNQGSPDSFFQYRVNKFHDFPYWFVATLALCIANGIWFVRLSALRVRGVFNPWTSGHASFLEFPIAYGKLFGGNLLMICFFLIVFPIIRNMNF